MWKHSFQVIVKMSVEKCGRHSSSRLIKTLRGPKGDGFDFTPEDDFDIKSKLFSHVQNLIESNNAVYLGYMKGNCLSVSGICTFDAQNIRIVNIATPLEGKRAVSLTYLQETCVQYGSPNELTLYRC